MEIVRICEAYDCDQPVAYEVHTEAPDGELRNFQLCRDCGPEYAEQRRTAGWMALIRPAVRDAPR